MKVLLSLGILSAAVIAFQLALMQVLSIVQWHHFAYMVISVALLGFGAAGTALTLFRRQLKEQIHSLLPGLMICCGISMALLTDISQLSFVRFDSYLLFASYSHFGRLLLTYLLFFVPFFLGALAIGLIFDHYVSVIQKVYFANLLGSAAGGLLMLAMIWLLLPARLPASISCLPVIAGIMLIPAHPANHKTVLSLLAFLALLLCAWKVSLPPLLQLSQYKDISRALLLPEAEMRLETTSPYGPIQAVRSPALRYAPGLSLVADQPVVASTAVFVNGDWLGITAGYREPDTAFLLHYTSLDLPYRIAERKEVLVLQSGTGIAVAHALSHHVTNIVAVEPNGRLVAALKQELAPDNDSLFYQRGVVTRTLEPRIFLASDTAHFDLISLPVVGSFGGSAGLYALQEQFLLTREAILKMWSGLKEGGAISFDAWMDYPARSPLKLLATLLEVLEQLKIRQPHRHIAAVRSWSTISFVLTRSPLTEREIRNIRNFCTQGQFDPAFLPDLQPGERTRYHQLQDSNFFPNMDRLFTLERKTLYADYDFNIIPATDNKPFFSQFIRWKSLPRLAEFFGNRSVPFFELGYLIVLLTLIQIAAVSFVLIQLPLFRQRWKRKNVPGLLLYFGGIGLGYMSVEMVFIQHFIFYFGHPLYAAGILITILLLFSGLGSFMSDYFTGKRKVLQYVLISIVVLLIIYSILLMPVLQKTLQASLPGKLLIVLALTAPLAFCMGIPFPAGLSKLARQQVQIVPWAWGINGCVSVITTALVTLIAVEAGFTIVIWLAALAYCLPLIVSSSGKWGL